MLFPSGYMAAREQVDIPAYLGSPCLLYPPARPPCVRSHAPSRPALRSYLARCRSGFLLRGEGDQDERTGVQSLSGGPERLISAPAVREAGAVHVGPPAVGSWAPSSGFLGVGTEHSETGSAEAVTEERLWEQRLDEGRQVVEVMEEGWWR
ncbi:unnamed protein product [Boreogadus saida]